MLSKMANEKKLLQINKNAILVYQLLPEDRTSALSYFSTESIEKVSCNSEGLQIVFKEYDLVVESILRQKIEVKGSFYKIYPKVTNLTVIGIGHYGTNSEIENAIVQYFGIIIDSYRIHEAMQKNGNKTVSLTNDYRVILDVPEVFAPKLRPIKLPHIKNKTFEVLFFCRLCRSNGHMQFQCQKIVKSSASSFTRYQNREISRTISYENDSVDSVVKKIPQSNSCTVRKKSKFRSDSHPKNEKKQLQYEKIVKSFSPSSRRHRSTEVHRRISYDNDSSDLIISRDSINCPQADFCVDRRNSKLRSDYHAKSVKEQLQRQKFVKSSPPSTTYHKNVEVSRRMSYDNDSSYLITNRDSIRCPPADFCVDRRNSKFHCDSHAKSVKEQFQCEKCVRSSPPSSTCHKNVKVPRRMSYDNDSSYLITNRDSIRCLPADFCIDRRNSKFRSDSHAKSVREQFQCEKLAKSSPPSSTCHKNMEVPRRMSYDNGFSDLISNRNSINCLQSESCISQRNSNVCLDSHVKNEEKQNHFPDENCFFKNSPHNASFAYQSSNVAGRISYENNSGNLPINKEEVNNLAPDYCVDRKNSKMRLDSQVKTEKKQSCYFPDQNRYSKNSFHNPSSTSDQNMDISRKISYDNYSPDVSVNNTEIKGTVKNFCCRRNSEIFPNFDVKIENEQNYSTDQKSTSKNKSYKKDILKYSYTKSTHSKPRNPHNVPKIKDAVDIVHKKSSRDEFCSMQLDDIEDCTDSNSPALKKQPIENLGKRKFNQDDNEVAAKRIQVPASNECAGKGMDVDSIKRKSGKTLFLKVLSSLLPPEADLFEAERIVKIACKCDPKDIPPEVKDSLQSIQNYNHGKDVSAKCRKFLEWIEIVLKKIKQGNAPFEKSFKDPVNDPTKNQEQVEDGKSDVQISKRKSSRTRKISLSTGIRKAILKTSGELDSTSMCQFLNVVRGRKKLLEVALAFTKNISKLGTQLLEIQNNYYKYVEKQGREEERDLYYIKRLRQRLLQQSKNTTEVALGKETNMAEMPSEIQSGVEEFSVKRELGITEIYVKRESGMTDKSETVLNMSDKSLKESNVADLAVKTESDTTEKESDERKITIKTELDTIDMSVKRETDMAEMSVKKETDILMRQSTSNEGFSSNYQHGASYFTNITQMLVPLTSIKSED